MRPAAFSAVAVCAAALVYAAPASAGEPPDQNDRCSRGGRNVCGTLGTGSYESSRYGTRWFGSYRGVIPGVSDAYCIDLRYWYPSRGYRFRADAAGVLRNRDGKRVSLDRQRRLAYAVWSAGRTESRAKAAAVMLFVHTMMGDGRPGELEPRVLGPNVTRAYRRISSAATRFHGPYRLRVDLPPTLTVGAPVEASVRVLSAAGEPVPGVELDASASGARLGATRLRSGSVGHARLDLRPTSAGTLRLVLRARGLPATLPRVFTPTVAAAARNGQRLVAPASQTLTSTVVRPVERLEPAVTTTVSSEVALPGATLHDRVRVTGLAGQKATVELLLYGPFASREAIRCDGRPHWRGELLVDGDGAYRSPGVELTRAGFYTFRERVVASESVRGSFSACGVVAETTLVRPAILAGGRRLSLGVRGEAGSAGGAPVRVRAPSLGIDAGVRPSVIDLRSGALAVPEAIGLTGWWRDGARPGATSGATLIAGHVDSARLGAGAFSGLRRATRGDLVHVTLRGGTTVRYRVVERRTYLKDALPADLYSRKGRRRLVLVTCGGPFDERARAYRDNVVVTAVPV